MRAIVPGAGKMARRRVGLPGRNRRFLNALDIVIAVLLLVSVALGIVRGFAREVLSVITWVLAFWIAQSFADILAPRLTRFQHPSTRHAVAWTAIFLGGLLLGALVSFAMGQIVGGYRVLTRVDRTLGAGFGLLRGALFAGLIIAIGVHAGWSASPQWRRSHLLPVFEPMRGLVESWLPAGWLGHPGQSLTDLDPQDPAVGPGADMPMPGTSSLPPASALLDPNSAPIKAAALRTGRRNP